jgi:hypothetical protein
MILIPAQVMFWLCLSLMMVHELDATWHKEWRLLPGLSSLPDRWGRIVFVLAHIPIFWWVLYQVGQDVSVASTMTNTITSPSTFRIGFDVFAIAHLGAHYLLRKHPANAMTGWDSWLLIVGAALAGLADLWLLW